MSGSARADDSSPSGRHVPALDGLRGVAILLVLACHTAERWPARVAERVPGLPALLHVLDFGWAGVDLFFVLSGFLITGILLDARGRPGAVWSFYARRVLRIFPLYYGALVFLILVVPRAGLVRDPSYLGITAYQSWYWAHSVNILFSLGGRSVIHADTGHFWSLSVEEHFYLVWPLVVLFAPRRVVWAVCAGCVAVAAASRFAFARAGAWDAAGWFTLARLDTLVFGAMLALALRDAGLRRRVVGWARRLLPPLAVGTAVWWLVPRFPAALAVARPVLGYGLLGLLFAALVALVVAAPPGGLAGRLFDRPVLRRLGQLSYGLYVIHYPLFGLLPRFPVLARLGDSPGGVAVQTLLMLAASYAAAAVSYRYFELPFLRLKRFVPMPRAGGAAAAGAAAARVA